MDFREEESFWNMLGGLVDEVEEAVGMETFGADFTVAGNTWDDPEAATPAGYDRKSQIKDVNEGKHNSPAIFFPSTIDKPNEPLFVPARACYRCARLDVSFGSEPVERKKSGRSLTPEKFLARFSMSRGTKNSITKTVEALCILEIA